MVCFTYMVLWLFVLSLGCTSAMWLITICVTFNLVIHGYVYINQICINNDSPSLDHHFVIPRSDIYFVLFVSFDWQRVDNVWSWWRHQMEKFSALLALCAGNSPVIGEFPSQRPVTRSFNIFFDLRLNNRLSKQSWGWWFETPSRSLWRHCNNDIVIDCGGLVRTSSTTKRFSQIFLLYAWCHDDLPD